VIVFRTRLLRSRFRPASCTHTAPRWVKSPAPSHQVTANPGHHRRVGRACREARRGATVGPVIVRISSPLNTDTPVVVVGRAVVVSHGIKGPLFLPSVRPFLRLNNNPHTTTSSTTNTTNQSKPIRQCLTPPAPAAGLPAAVAVGTSCAVGSFSCPRFLPPR